MGRVLEMEGCREILRCCGPLLAAAERYRGARMGCCPRSEESARIEKLPLVCKTPCMSLGPSSFGQATFLKHGG